MKVRIILSWPISDYYQYQLIFKTEISVSYQKWTNSIETTLVFVPSLVKVDEAKKELNKPN